ncbi:hypothetical protein, partial [Streptomyces sp. NPDC003832]
GGEQAATVLATVIEALGAEVTDGAVRLQDDEVLLAADRDGKRYSWPANYAPTSACSTSACP